MFQRERVVYWTTGICAGLALIGSAIVPLMEPSAVPVAIAGAGASIGIILICVGRMMSVQDKVSRYLNRDAGETVKA